MSTVHNPKNFEPRDYRVIEYFDNHPPEYYFGMDMDHFAHMVEQWKADLERVYGPDFRSKIHRCVHCGQGNVRYIVACEHIPSGEVVTFGDVCVNRLGFANASEFKSKHIRTRANLERQAKKNAEARQKIMDENPGLEAAIKCLDEHKDSTHMRNTFARDIQAKFFRYHKLSERQITAFVQAVARDHEYEAKRQAEDNEEKGPAPEGRVEVKGEVLSVKWRDNDFGGSLKMLVKLANNSKVWCTAPNYGEGIDRGIKIHFRATFSVSKDDPHFAFGSRPHLIGIEDAAEESCQAA